MNLFYVSTLIIFLNTLPLSRASDEEIKYYENKCDHSKWLPGHECFSLALALAKTNGKENHEKAKIILNVLCFRNHPQACESITQIGHIENFTENNNNYNYALSLVIHPPQAKDLPNLKKALKIISRLCKKNFSNSCENKKIVEQNIAFVISTIKDQSRNDYHRNSENESLSDKIKRNAKENL
jgi:hypothetical protein